MAAPDPRLLQIPRGPVLDLGARGDPAAEGWPRVDRQAPSCLTVSGRAAILLGLRQFGIGTGDRVLVPTYHCPTMVEPVVRLGARPVFYPISADGSADLDHLRQADLADVRVMLAGHFFGLPLDLRPVRKFCDEHGLWLIEDCAHAFFGHSVAGPLGSLGDVAIASLPKFFPVVEGGCLVARTTTLPELGSPGFVHELRVAWDSFELAAATGRLGALGTVVRALTRLKNRLRRAAAQQLGSAPDGGTRGSPFETIDLALAGRRAARFVHRVTAGADAGHIVATRRRNYRRFSGAFVGAAGLRPLFPDLPAGAAPYVFPLWVDDPEALYRSLRTRGIPLSRWDVVWPGTPSSPGDAGAAWATHVFQLVCHQDMSEDDVDAVAAAIKQERQRLGT